MPIFLSQYWVKINHLFIVCKSLQKCFVTYEQEVVDFQIKIETVAVEKQQCCLSHWATCQRLQLIDKTVPRGESGDYVDVMQGWMGSKQSWGRCGSFSPMAVGCRTQSHTPVRVFALESLISCSSNNLNLILQADAWSHQHRQLSGSREGASIGKGRHFYSDFIKVASIPEQLSKSSPAGNNYYGLPNLK